MLETERERERDGGAVWKYKIALVKLIEQKVVKETFVDLEKAANTT
jgi:hypothetical protein